MNNCVRSAKSIYRMFHFNCICETFFSFFFFYSKSILRDSIKSTNECKLLYEKLNLKEQKIHAQHYSSVNYGLWINELRAREGEKIFIFIGICEIYKEVSNTIFTF